MQLYNKLTHRLEDFTAREGEVGIYVCGVTPYDTTHLGHAFTYVFFDTLARYIRYRGDHVTFVENVTDIDDDVLRKSKQLGMAWDELGRQETARFMGDMAALNVTPPDFFPKATQETPMMIEIISALIAKNLAYEREGNVYFRTADVPAAEYGKLVGIHDRAALLALSAERGNFPDDPLKEDPLDFVLWQAAKPGEPTWPSPWGAGRPGWHIECSAMSLRYLGKQVDIHGGGADLEFPHHPSEILQSENYTDVVPFVRFWLHTGMVKLGGEKMSKSLGNLILAANLLKTYSADAIRLYLLMHHYRTGWEHDPQELEQAAMIAARWQSLVADTAVEPADPTLVANITAALDNDFDSPTAIARLDQLAGSGQAGAAQTVREIGSGVLGLRLQ